MTLSSLFIYLNTSQVFAFGLFINGQEGIMTSSQSRVFLAQSNDEAHIMLQQQYTGDVEQDVYWLIPVPNIDNLETNPPQMNIISGDVFTELSELSKPRFEGACGEDLSEESSDGEQRGWAVGDVSLNQTPVVFNATKLIPPTNMPDMLSEFENYLTRLNIPISETLQEYIRWSVDQNYMFILIKFPAGSLSEVTMPSFSVTLPEVSAYRLNLRLLALSMIEQNSDLVFWILDEARYKGSIATNELDFMDVRFNEMADNMNGQATNYLQMFDTFTFALQSQMLIREYSAAVDNNTFTNSILANLRSQLVATRLTRLRGRFIVAALRNTVNIISFIEEQGGNYDRVHRVSGSNCTTQGGMEAGIEAGTEGGMMGGNTSGMMAGTEGGTTAGVMAGMESGTEVNPMAGTQDGLAGTDTSENGGLMINLENSNTEAGSSGGGSSDEGCQQSSYSQTHLLFIFGLLMVLRLNRRTRKERSC
jgi:hypothetical protein